MDVYWEPRHAPYTSVCISMCLHSQHTWKHTREMVSKEKRKKNKSALTEEPKTHLVVSRSHSPFFNFSFSIVVASRPVTQPPKTSLSDCQLSWKLLRSVFSLLLLLQCIVGSAVRYSKNVLCRAKHCEAFSKTNEPTSAVYCLCERSLGTFACRPAQKNLKVTSILFCS